MKSIFNFIGPLVGILLLFFCFLDSWLSSDQKKAIKDKIAVLWAKFADNDPLIVVQTPLKMLGSILDDIYGVAIFSRKYLWRSATISTAMLALTFIIALGVSGKSTMFSMMPWQSFDWAFEAIEKSTTNNNELFKDKKPEAVAKVKEWITKIQSLRTSTNKYIYSIICILFVIATNAAVVAVCVAAARKIINEMLIAKTLLTLFSLVFFNSILCAVIFLGCLSIICVAAMPILWPVALLLLACFALNAFLALWLIMGALLAVCYLGPVWIRIIALNASYPCIALLLISILSLVVFPIRHSVHKTIEHILDLITRNEKGVLAAIIGVLTLISSVIGVIAAKWN